jgi:hypothetical protein
MLPFHYLSRTHDTFFSLPYQRVVKLLMNIAETVLAIFVNPT